MASMHSCAHAQRTILLAMSHQNRSPRTTFGCQNQSRGTKIFVTAPIHPNSTFIVSRIVDLKFVEIVFTSFSYVPYKMLPYIIFTHASLFFFVSFSLHTFLHSLVYQVAHSFVVYSAKLDLCQHFSHACYYFQPSSHLNVFEKGYYTAG